MRQKVCGTTLLKIDGQCHCGKLKFEAETTSNIFGICHCTDCQTMSSSAFGAAVLVPKEQFQLVDGHPRTYVKTTSASGNKSMSAFCEECGTRIYTCAVENPIEIRVRLGVINQRASFVPGRQIWRKSALPWIDEIETVPAFQQNPA